MPSLPRSVVIALALFTLAPLVHGSGSGDPGPGDDASGSSSSPTPLAHDGWYSGTFGDRNDADWYSLASSASGPQCSQVQLGPSTWTRMTLGDGTHQESLTAPPYQTTSLSLATLGPTAILGLVPTPNPNTGASATPGAYAFNLSLAPAATLGPGDAASGADAGSSFASAVPLRAACSAGHLDPLGADATDVYSFNASSAGDALFSVASTSPSMSTTITDAAGNLVSAPLGSSGLALVTLPSSGTYYVTASANGVGTADYVLSLVGLGDPGPCRPGCSVS